MKQVINISENLEMVLTKGECGYNEVLLDFEQASSIRIVTYNISKELDNRLKFIQNLNSEKEIKIITNIPGRFNQYYERAISAKKKAHDTIVSYMKNLSPKNFDSNYNSFFNFNNHSKIMQFL